MSTTDRATPSRLRDGEIERLREQTSEHLNGTRIALEIAAGDGGLADEHASASVPSITLLALLSELQSLRAASEWRTDMENAPRDTDFIGLFSNGDVVVCFYLDNSKTSHPWAGYRPRYGAEMAGRMLTKWCAMPSPDSTNTDIMAFMREREARLVEALEPFTDVEGEGNEDFPNDTKIIAKFGRTVSYSLTLGDLRHASKILQESEGE